MIMRNTHVNAGRFVFTDIICFGRGKKKKKREKRREIERLTLFS